MASTRNGRAAQGKNGGFGLLAYGSNGPWEIAVDEHITDPDRWRAQVEGPSASFYFEIPSPEIVTDMACFFNSALIESLVLSKEQTIPVTLIRDDEYTDRFFLVVGPTANPIVRLVMSGQDVVCITEALRQVIDDINNEG